MPTARTIPFKPVVCKSRWAFACMCVSKVCVREWVCGVIWLCASVLFFVCFFFNAERVLCVHNNALVRVCIRPCVRVCLWVSLCCPLLSCLMGNGGFFRGWGEVGVRGGVAVEAIQLFPCKSQLLRSSISCTRTDMHERTPHSYSHTHTHTYRNQSFLAAI